MRGLVVPAILVLAALAVLVSLGNWQVRRLAWKEDLIARATERPHGPVRDLPPVSAWPKVDLAEDEYRPFRLTGHFLNEDEAHVFTSLSDGHGPYSGPGFWIVTPFALADGGTVLVNRGFAPQDREQPAERGETPPAGTVTLVGLMRPDETRGYLTPKDEPGKNVFYARAVSDIAAAKGLSGPLAPFTIDLVAAETPPGGLPQAGETRMVFPNNHLQYAITWYGLAIVLLAIFAQVVWQRLKT